MLTRMVCSATMRVLTWNLQWAKKGMKRGDRLTGTIREVDPDVVCFTEVTMGMVPEGHAIEADPDYGYSHAGDRRKVVLWSKTPWIDVDRMGSPALPAGRFVAGVTQGIRLVGVCIPWKDAHVTTGRKDRKSWEDHLAFCRGLQGIVDVYQREKCPTCVLGDFNQRIPAKGFSAASDALSSVFPPAFSVTTRGLLCPEGRPLIDHLVVSAGFSVAKVGVLAKIADDGLRLSDHPGVWAEIEEARAP